MKNTKFVADDSAGAITLKKRRSWSSVPDDVLEDTRLSLRARAVLSWMLGRPAGWELYVGHMRHVLDVSEHVWVSIRAELEGIGYYTQSRSRDAAGKIVWVREVSDTPTPPTPKPSRMDGAMHGDAMHGGVGDIALSVKHDHTAACTAAAAPAAVAPPPPPAGGKRRRTRHSGIETWEADDPAEAERIEATHPAEAVAAACASISARRNGKGNPTSPTPGLVVAEIQRLAAAQAAAQALRSSPPAEKRKATKNGWQKTKAEISQLIGSQK